MSPKNSLAVSGLRKSSFFLANKTLGIPFNRVSGVFLLGNPESRKIGESEAQRLSG